MLGCLPWEKWLPPYIVGPLLCAISTIPLFSDEKLPWYLVLAMPFCFAFGAWGTYVWVARRENVFDIEAKTKATSEQEARK